MSNIVHKVKDALTHDKHDKHSTSTNAGPHDSNTTNKLDPRVDSDRDHRAAPSAATGVSTYNTTGNSATGSANNGPHGSSLGNKLDPRVDNDRGQYGTTGTTGATGTIGGMTTGGPTSSNTGSTNAGPHDSNLANKLDPRIDSDMDNRARHQQHGNAASSGLTGTTGTTGGMTTGGPTSSNTGSTNAGPHGSNLANKLDPRIDSDMDNRARHQQHGNAAHSGLAGTTGTTGGMTTGGPISSNTRSTNAGPHDSNLVNKLDPRIDSDMDNRARHQQHGNAAHSGLTGTTGTTGGMTTGGLTSSNTGSTNAGPHGSNLANKLDPRINSDMDNRARHQQHGNAASSGLTGATGTTGGMTTGGPISSNTRSTNAGPHDSNLVNKLDPRVDSDMDNRALHQQIGNTAPSGSSHATSGTGTARNTAGPHHSNVANKLDPRIDSDLDASRTVGGNATFR